MSKSDFINFCKGVESRIDSIFGHFLKQIAAEEQAAISTQSEALERSIDDPSVAGSEIYVSIPKLYSRRVLIKYSILSWWMSPLAKFELQEILRKKSVQLHYPEIGAYLYSKEIMLARLYLENDLTHGDLFGNILTDGVFENIITADGKVVRVKKKDFLHLAVRFRRKPLKKVFRRGYNDHGSLAEFGSKVRQEELQIELSSKQLEIELDRTREALQTKIYISDALLFLEKIRGID